MTKAFFEAQNAQGNVDLWITDGTSAGTIDLHSFALSFSRTSAAFDFTPFGNGKVLFDGYDPATGREPWVSDGTPGGTFPLKDVAPGTASSSSHSFGAGSGAALGNGRVLFAAAPGGETNNTYIPYVTDGTTTGTVPLLPSGALGTGAAKGSEVGLGDGRAVFTVVNGPASKVYVTDGSLAGTQAIASVDSPGGLVSLGDGRALFSTVNQMWVTDGSLTGTHPIANVYGRGFTALGNGKAIFTGTTVEHGSEPWITDGTAAGTFELADFTPGSGSSNPSAIYAHFFETTANGLVAFAAYNVQYFEVALTDGTTQGTKTINVDGLISSLQLTPGGGEVLFTAIVYSLQLNASFPAVYLLSEDGVRQIKFGDRYEGVAADNIVYIGNGEFVLHARQGAQSGPNNEIVYQNDGLWLITPNSDNATFLRTVGFNYSQVANYLGLGNGTGLFAANGGDGLEPWTSDGTSTGTFELKDILPGAASSYPQNFFAIGGAAGTAGNDHLFGGGGNNTLDGGAGFDWLDLTAFGRRSAIITLQDDGGIKVAGPGETDVLHNVEEIRFIDGNEEFASSSIVAEVTRLYDSALGRSPDQAGLHGWTVAVKAGTPLVAIANAFAGSAEFTARYGNLDNAGYVEKLYSNTLHRASDAPGKAAWVNALNAGESRGDVLVGFSESVEHQNNLAPTVAQGLWDLDESAAQVARLYDATFSRLPDLPGLTSWKLALKLGVLTLKQEATYFAASPEFNGTYGSLDNSHFVELLYNNTLHRASDPPGKAAWVNALNSNALTRADVLLGFSESAEHIYNTAPNINNADGVHFGILFA